MKNSNQKISPLEELRAEKEQLKAEFSATEDKILSQIDYASNNFGSIVMSALLGSFSKHTKKSDTNKHREDAPLNSEQSVNASSTVMETVWAGLQLTYPYLIEIAKPVVLSFVTNKISGLFKKKKNKSKAN